MKNLILFALIISIITSCKRDTVIIPNAPKKNISQLVIGTELPMQKKGQEIYVGVQYSKDYTTADQVSLTLNNQAGTIVYSGFTQLLGSQVLFKLPAINQSGTYKLKASIKNDQGTVEKEIDYKIVEDLSINTIWENLTKNYLLNVNVDLQRTTSNGEFILNTRASPVSAGSSELLLSGEFTDDYDSSNTNRAPRVFIPGLEGVYRITYANEQITQLWIVHSLVYNKPGFSGQKFYNELKAAFGSPISTNQTTGDVITNYNYPNYSITNHLDIQVMYTVIKKK